MSSPDDSHSSYTPTQTIVERATLNRAPDVPLRARPDQAPVVQADFIPEPELVPKHELDHAALHSQVRGLFLDRLRDATRDNTYDRRSVSFGTLGHIKHLMRKRKSSSSSSLVTHWKALMKKVNEIRTWTLDESSVLFNKVEYEKLFQDLRKHMYAKVYDEVYRSLITFLEQVNRLKMFSEGDGDTAFTDELLNDDILSEMFARKQGVRTHGPRAQGSTPAGRFRIETNLFGMGEDAFQRRRRAAANQYYREQEQEQEPEQEQEQEPEQPQQQHGSPSGRTRSRRNPKGKGKCKGKGKGKGKGARSPSDTRRNHSRRR